MVVDPAHLRRQRHKNGFCPAVGFQPEQRSTVVHEVELNIAASPDALPLPFVFSPDLTLPALHDRKVAFEESGSGVPDELEEILEMIALVVEENSADAPRFIAMLDEKVFVAGPLEPWIPFRVVPFTERFQSPVKMSRILFVKVIRRKVGPAAEPGIAIFQLQVSQVHMDGWHHRADRMKDE